jgi:hypothetical protein
VLLAIVHEEQSCTPDQLEKAGPDPTVGRSSRDGVAPPTPTVSNPGGAPAWSVGVPGPWTRRPELAANRSSGGSSSAWYGQVDPDRVGSSSTVSDDGAAGVRWML